MLEIGIVGTDSATELGLGRAATRHSGLLARTLTVEDVADARALDGLVVDVPLESRGKTLRGLVQSCRVPILAEAPAADNLEDLRALADMDAVRIVSANPLRYALHTRRLLEEMRVADDPVETFFAAQRCRGQWIPSHALSRLLDYLVAICPSEITRVAAMAYQDPPILVVSLRYASGAIGSLEIGAHLPASFPNESELIVECFCRSHAFHCTPDSQAVRMYDAATQRQLDWQPEPSDSIVNRFAIWIQGGQRPEGDAARDLHAMTLAVAIMEAARTDRVSSHVSE
jgi:predicted dehydrogenase